MESLRGFGMPGVLAALLILVGGSYEIGGLPIVPIGAPAINTTYEYLQGNLEMLPYAVWAMFLAGFSEEIVFRGFLFERLRTLLSAGAIAGFAIVVLSSAAFGAIHLDTQGIWGATQAFIVALVFGSIFWRWRQIWTLAVAHTSFHLTALALICFGVEKEVGGSVFG